MNSQISSVKNSRWSLFLTHKAPLPISPPAYPDLLFFTPEITFLNKRAASIKSIKNAGRCFLYRLKLFLSGEKLSPLPSPPLPSQTKCIIIKKAEFRKLVQSCVMQKKSTKHL